MTKLPITVTTGQLARILGVSTVTLLRMRRTGQMPVPECAGHGHPRFPLVHVANWLGFDSVPDNLDDLRLITIAEAGQLLGLSRATAYRRLHHMGKGAIRVGCETRYVHGAVSTGTVIDTHPTVKLSV